jgi:nitrate reductase gamma subunit
MEAPMYDFLTGPMFWLSLGICLIGMLVRLVLYFRGLSWQLDRVAYKAYPIHGLKGAVNSIVKWLIPFGTYGWRKQPFMTVIFFGFHIGAVLVPLFLLAHNLVLKEKIGFSLITLNPLLADVLSWTVIVSAVFLALRRIALPQVRILTTWYDYLILLLAVAPFVTGLVARYELGNYSFWLTVHILCGEALLIAVPFTKLSHIVLFFASRAQLGMDYGIKRGGMKGKGMAW